MKVQAECRIIFIRPRKEFGSFAHACQLAALEAAVEVSPLYFDVPLLAVIVDAAGEPIWTPILYLADCALRSRSVTGDTVRSYAEALHTWLDFLARSQVKLQRVTEDIFAAYRSQLVHCKRPHTGRVYSSATANHRISVVCGFHLWAQKRGLLETPLGAYLLIREADLRAHFRTRAVYGKLVPRSLAPTVLQRLPRLLSHDEIRLLFQCASSPYRLIFKWALLTGLRRFEICQLTIEQLPTPQQLSLSRDGFAQINVLRKGARDITMHVPVRLIEETHWYLLTDRATPRTEDQNAIFVGRRGNAIKRNSVSRAFRKCADRVGTDATFHHLRHTFAVNVLKMLDCAALEGQTLNSLKTLQVLMGHASLESTEIYLRAMDVSSDAVMQALDYLYGATL